MGEIIQRDVWNIVSGLFLLVACTLPVWGAFAVRRRRWASFWMTLIASAGLASTVRLFGMSDQGWGGVVLLVYIVWPLCGAALFFGLINFVTSPEETGAPWSRFQMIRAVIAGAGILLPTLWLLLIG